MNLINSVYRLVLFVCILGLVFGCATQSRRTKSSVMDYLYSSEEERVIKPTVPTLKLPLTLGIAFTPDNNSFDSAITEIEKSKLLESIAKEFNALTFVERIEIIQSDYLTPNGGFTNLEQIKTMYDIDVIALVSYDQVQFTDQNILSLTYWTIAGAYIFPGDMNDTSTMLDTVVYDIESKKMLFRAPGKSVVKGLATAIHSSKSLREDRIEGFELASTEMTKNLKIELDKFKKRIREQPEQIKIITRPGYTSGGALGYFQAVVLLVFGLLIKLLRCRRMSQKRNLQFYKNLPSYEC